MATSSRHLEVAQHADHWLATRLQAALLLVAHWFLMVLLGWAVLGPTGVLVATLLALSIPVLAPRLSSRWLVRHYHAEPLDAAPLLDCLGHLAVRAGLDRPPLLYYLPTGAVNAFTLLSDRGPLIVLTDGLLRTLAPRELAAVMAHEVAHIANHDLQVLGLADVLSHLTRLFSRLGLLLVLLSLPLALLFEVAFPWPVVLLLLFAPLVGLLLQLALSRTREFEADFTAARLVGDPDGLASALGRLERGGGDAGAWPFPGRDINPSLLRSHPPVEQRIARLRELAPPVEPIALHLARHLVDRQSRRSLRQRPFGYWF